MKSGSGRTMRSEVALGVMLVAAGVIGVTMLRGTAAPAESESATTTAPQQVIAPGQAFVSLALPAGSYPPHVASGDVVQLFAKQPVEDGTTSIVTGSSTTAVVHAVSVDPMGSDSVITLLGSVMLGEFLVASSDVRLVIVGAAP